MREPVGGAGRAPAHRRVEVVAPGRLQARRQGARPVRRHGGAGHEDPVRRHGVGAAVGPEEHGLGLVGIDHHRHHDGGAPGRVGRAGGGPPALAGEAVRHARRGVVARDREPRPQQRQRHAVPHGPQADHGRRARPPVSTHGSRSRDARDGPAGRLPRSNDSAIIEHRPGFPSCQRPFHAGAIHARVRHPRRHLPLRTLPVRARPDARRLRQHQRAPRRRAPADDADRRVAGARSTPRACR